MIHDDGREQPHGIGHSAREPAQSHVIRSVHDYKNERHPPKKMIVTPRQKPLRFRRRKKQRKDVTTHSRPEMTSESARNSTLRRKKRTETDEPDALATQKEKM